MTFTAEQKRILALLCIIQFSHVVDFILIMPLGPTLMRTFLIDPHQFGLLVSVYTFAAGICGLVSSSFIDKFDRKPVLISLYLGFAASTLACALSPTYFWLLIARSFTGAFGGVLSALVLAIVGDVIPFSHRGRAMGIIMTAFSAASIFGVPIGLVLANLSSWHAPFLALGILSFAVAAVVVKIFPSLREHILKEGREVNFLTPLIRALTQTNQLKAVILMSLLMLGQFAIIPFISPSLVSNAGLKEHYLPLFYIVGGLCTTVSGPLFGRAVDKFGVRTMFTICVPFSVIGFLIITNLTPQPLSVILLIGGFLFVSMSGRMIPSQTLITSTVHATERGGFMSIIGAVQQLSMAVGSLLAGLIVSKAADGTLTDLPLVGALASVVTLIAIPLGRRIVPFKNE